MAGISHHNIIGFLLKWMVAKNRPWLVASHTTASKSSVDEIRLSFRYWVGSMGFGDVVILRATSF